MKTFSSNPFGLFLLFAGLVAALGLLPNRPTSCMAQNVPISPTIAAESASADQAPAWSLTDLAGKNVKSSDFAGKVVILDFWATWCPPCRAEIPGFIELQEKYGKKGLQIVGVSLDEGGPQAVAAFVRKTGMNYPVVMGDESVVNAFGGVRALPTTFVIDRAGKIAVRHEGYASKDALEQILKKLL
jgi:cytochrome c biogenesis protein CcmG/thiol:disulfide interchange protein DsbE